MGNEISRWLATPENYDDVLRHKIPIEPPREGPHGSPHRCFHIQVDYIEAMLAVVDYYAHPDAFTGTLAQREQAAQWFIDLQLLLMMGNMDCSGDIDMRIRQSSTDPCVLEVSYDGGGSWQTGFDYGLCMLKQAAQSSPDISIMLYQSQQQTIELMDTYDGTPESIAPGMEYDGTGADDFRDLAVCAAIAKVVLLAAAASSGLLQDLDNLLWDVNQKTLRLMEELIKIGEAISSATDGGDDLVGKVFWWVARNYHETSTAFWEEHTPTPALGDKENRRAIICYAFDNVAGDDFDYGSYRDMFAGVSSLEGVTDDDEFLLADFVLSTEIYVNILEWLEEFNADLIAGDVTYYCPCGEWEESITDFNNIPNVVSTEFVDGAGGFGASGELVGDDDGPGDMIRVDFNFVMPAHYHLDKMKIVYTAVDLSDEDSWLELRHSYSVWKYLEYPAEGTDKDVTVEHSSDGSVVIIRFDTGLTGVSLSITELVLTGAGTNPFS